MEYYAVLAVATVVILLLSVAVWNKTRQPAFILGFGFLYYWSLYGGWLVVNRGHGASRTYRFEYLFYKLFPVYLDRDYFWTLLLYAAFVVVIQLTVLHVARRRVSAADAPAEPVCISHGKVLVLTGILTVVAYAIVGRVIVAAAAGSMSAYGQFARGASSVPFGSVYQVLHQSALILVLTGLSVLASGRQARYLVARSSPVVLGYALVVPALLGLNLAMGNRSMFLFASVGAGLFYLVNTRRPNKALLASAAVVAATALVLLGIVRSAGGAREFGDEDLVGKARYAVSEAMSQDVEAYAAHSSMYGTLQKKVPLTYGASLIWLATSVIPSAIRPELVPLSYFHYAAHVGAAEDQGFTLHHATGWYINFAVPGVIFGAMLFAWIWATFYNQFLAIDRRASHFARIFFTMAFWNFTAYAPIVIRSGPETYKGVAIECLLFPTLLLLAASLHVVKHANRPRLSPIRFSRIFHPAESLSLAAHAARDAR